MSKRGVFALRYSEDPETEPSLSKPHSPGFFSRFSRHLFERPPPPFAHRQLKSLSRCFQDHAQTRRAGTATTTSHAPDSTPWRADLSPHPRTHDIRTRAYFRRRTLPRVAERGSAGTAVETTWQCRNSRGDSAACRVDVTLRPCAALIRPHSSVCTKRGSVEIA